MHAFSSAKQRTKKSLRRWKLTAIISSSGHQSVAKNATFMSGKGLLNYFFMAVERWKRRGGHNWSDDVGLTCFPNLLSEHLSGDSSAIHLFVHAENPLSKTLAPKAESRNELNEKCA